MSVSDEDFCLEHGRDFMRCDQGPIPYCKACEDSQRKNTMGKIQTSQNTDRELWRGPDEGNGSYYADSIFVTEGGLGINCGGYVIVMPLRKWHRAAKLLDFASELEASINNPAKYIASAHNEVWPSRRCARARPERAGPSQVATERAGTPGSDVNLSAIGNED